MKPAMKAVAICKCRGGCGPRESSPWLIEQIGAARSGILAVAGLRVDGFVCPLCLRSLPESCATVAHSPAECVGGKAQTFLCKACNSFLGTTYEAVVCEWIARLREAQTSGTATHHATLRHGDGAHVYADASLSARGGIKARIRGKNDKAWERFAADAKSGKMLSIGFARMPGEANIKITYLCWAYLLLFQRLGYAFVFARSGNAAREAILSHSTNGLGPAFFSNADGFAGEIDPILTGLLVRRSPVEDIPVAIAARIGAVVVSLPMSDDPGGRYSRLAKNLNDRDALVVAPFDAVCPPRSLMNQAADIGYQGSDHVRHRVLLFDSQAVQAALTAAAAPPSGRTVERRRAQHWDPPLLSLPPIPRSETWRTVAADYLLAQFIEAIPSTSADDDDRWIQSIREINPVAAQHIVDMCRLFRDGADPSIGHGPRSDRLLADLNPIVEEYGVAKARILRVDERLITQGEPYFTWSLALLIGDQEKVIGPYFTYDTLVLAMRQALLKVASTQDASALP